MSENLTSGAVNTPAAPPAANVNVTTLAPAVDVAELVNGGIKAERLRCSEIRKNVKLSGLSEEFAELHIEQGTAVDEVGRAIFAELAKKAATQPATDNRTSDMQVLRDQADSRRAGVAAALLHKHDRTAFPLTNDLGREYMSMSLLEIAKECLQAKGVNPRSMSRSEIAQLALSGSDLPNITADVANKTLRQAYEAAPRTFASFCRQASAPDFKNINRVQLSEMPQLTKVNPSGEIKTGYLTDGKETYALATYASIVNINRQTIINDDLQALTRVPAGYGVAAATLESDTVWGILTANANLADGIALFHASHSNLLTGAGSALSVAAVGAAITQMVVQKGLDKKTFLSIQPRFILVPAVMQLAASQLIAGSFFPAVTTNVVPDYVKALTVIAEPRLDVNSTTGWYLTASPSQVDTIEYSYLEGNDGVYLEQRMGFDVDGIEFKARLDLGAKAIDFRGMQKNAGA